MYSQSCLMLTWLPVHSGTRSSSVRSRTPPICTSSDSSFLSFFAARVAKLSWPWSLRSVQATSPFRVGLSRHEKPVIGFGNSQIDCFVGALLFGLGLSVLELVEIQCDSVVPDRGPSKVLA